MLTEDEWLIIEPLLNLAISDLREFRRQHGVSLKEAFDRDHGEAVLNKYHGITGCRETNVDTIWHHRLSRYDAPCAVCGKLLRTPKATYFAECGAVVA